jgi:hypothetical protein
MLDWRKIKSDHAIYIFLESGMTKYYNNYLNKILLIRSAGILIHAKMNKLVRRFSPMRPKEERLWKMFEEYEKQNGINKESIQAQKIKPNLPIIANASLAQLAVLSII